MLKAVKLYKKESLELNIAEGDLVSATQDLVKADNDVAKETDAVNLSSHSDNVDDF